MLRRLDLIRPEDQSLPNAEDQAQVQAGSQVPGRTLVDRGRVRSPIVPDENRKDLAQKWIKGYTYVLNTNPVCQHQQGFGNWLMAQ